MTIDPQNGTLPPELFRAENLPTIPAVAVEVLRLCRDEDTTLDDLATVLAHDTALSARLLRFANSTLYNLGSEVSTLQRATLVLGMKTVQLMSLTFSLASSLPKQGTSSFDYPRFWKRSITRAVAGRAVAGLVGTMTEDECFLCGLLGEIGQLVLAECLPEQYAPVLEAAGDDWPTIELEKRLLGYDHIEVGRTLLENWEFPEILGRALQAMHSPSKLDPAEPEALRQTTHALLLACHVTDLFTESDPSSSLKQLEKDADDLLSIAPGALEDLVAGMEGSVRETSEMLNMDLPTGRTVADIMAEARGEYIEQSVGSRRPTHSGGPNQILLERIRKDESLRDPVLRVANHDAFELFLEGEIDRRLESTEELPLGMLVLRTDQGDLADPAQRHFADVLQRLVRGSDLLAYVGGGEFAVVMSDSSPFGLRTLAERLRRGVCSRPFVSERGALAATLTIGGLCLGRVSSRSDGLAQFEAARRFLAKARKQRGDHCLIHGGLLRPGA